MDTSVSTSALLEDVPPRTAAAVAHARVAVPALCQPGVVLRSLLFVQFVVAVGAGFGADSLGRWLASMAMAAAVAVPATLAWLVVACAATPLLARLAPPVRPVVAGAVGAAVTALAWMPLSLLALGAGATQSMLPAVVAGAAIGAGVYHWLALRARTALPAATEARLSELQSRIRPHFLFNTLNTAIALVRVDPGRAEEVLEDLCELFRAALEAADAPSTLGDEIRLARMYLDIESMRFGARLRVVWDIEPGAEGARVPPLLLQPLVENAVRHGIETQTEGGLVTIKARVRNGRAWVQVDNTVGGPAQPGHGIGVASARERLRLMHDLDAVFEAGPYRSGYRVRLAVPL
jgi:two-component system sensor histidine kinase AlgZ